MANLISANFDKSVDLNFTWSLYDDSDSLIIRQNVSLGGPIEIAEVEAQVIEIGENSRTVKVDCPVIVCNQIEQNGAMYRIELEIEAFSLGTVRHSIGNFLFQNWNQYAWQFIAEALPEVDVSLHYDPNMFILGEESTFELDVYGIKLTDYSYEISWQLGNDVNVQSNENSYFIIWPDTGYKILSYQFKIPKINIEENGYLRILIIEDQLDFGVDLPQLGETDEAVEFIPSSSIDRKKEIIGNDNSLDFFISIICLFSGKEVWTNEISYFSSSHDINAFEEDGQYQIFFKLYRVTYGGTTGTERQLLEQVEKSISIVTLDAFYSFNFPSTVRIIERLELSVVHNFYSFASPRLEFSWNFGDGQLEPASERDTTEVSFPRPGFFNVTCNITSTVTANTIILSRIIEVFYPIRGLELNYDKVVVGPNGVIEFSLEADEGYPIYINVDYGDQIERDYQALSDKIIFSHTYQLNGNYSINFGLTSPGSDQIEAGLIQVVKPIPVFEFFGVNFSRIPEDVLNIFLLKWSDDLIVTAREYGTIRIVLVQSILIY